MKIAKISPMNQELHFKKVVPIDFTFHNLTYTIPVNNHLKQERTILRGLNGICPSSQITAILGSSGAGKSTLLNALCKRLHTDDKGVLSGQIKANGIEYSHSQFNQFANYVMQDDQLIESFTVRECLQFAANLKGKKGQEDKEDQVNSLIKNLKLEACQNTLIGGHYVKGVSGGEKKRTSIGFELVCDPLALFLDEPTSGLDSFTAFILINQLRSFAQDKKRTVVLTIHQPSSDIWNMFDRVMLMIDGQFIYQGDGGENVLNYFNKNGFCCPPRSNPPDYFLSIMHQEVEFNRNNTAIYFSNYAEQQDKLTLQSMDIVKIDSQLPKTEPTNWTRQFYYLFIRAILIQVRNPILFQSKIGQVLGLSFFLGMIYWQLPDGTGNPTDVIAANNKNGLLFFLATGSLMESLNPCLLSLPLERFVFLREYNSKLYYLSPYFFSKLIVDLATDIIVPIIFSAVIYWMTGLNADIYRFCFFTLTMILLQFTGIGLGYFQGSLFKDPFLAFTIANVALLPIFALSGFYRNRNDMSSWMAWMNYLSPFKYGYEALLSNEYEGTAFIPNPIDSQAVEFGKWASLGYLSLHFVFYVVAGFFSLKRTTKTLK